ncbi:hypothetical protein JOB18_011134 [Solea senegalensis]|uniref:Uncharacterized protein n=1 Tax=Solea senegalensis TaxID=28829 RepID=A0AAV6QKP5_SOLSE|nr:hypothetical protein JOB18_011134 [Solea senegalensis]
MMSMLFKNVTRLVTQRHRCSPHSQTEGGSKYRSCAIDARRRSSQRERLSDMAERVLAVDLHQDVWIHHVTAPRLHFDCSVHLCLHCGLR